MTLSAEQGFVLFHAMGTVLFGYAIHTQADVQQGIDHIQSGMDEMRQVGVEFWQPHFLCLLAELYMRDGQIHLGLSVLDEALTQVEKTGERQSEAEIHRLRGVLKLTLSPEEPLEAERCFRQALDVAKRQQARLWELRAAVSLARLWLQLGRHRDGHDLLAPVYQWFSEGFDTADLQEAKALLEALESEPQDEASV